MSDGAVKPRIARIWRGRVPAHKADDYARYNSEAGIKPLEENALGEPSLREDRETAPLPPLRGKDAEP